MGFSISSLAPIVGAALGAPFGPAGMMVGSTIGAGISNSYSADQALKAGQEANQANIDMQRQTNSQEIELANTAHQREVADLKAAGLNPILSARLGGSATPILQSPSMSSLAPTIQASARQVADTTMDANTLYNQFALQRSQVALNSAQALKAANEANLADTQNQRILAEMPAIKGEAGVRAYEAFTRQKQGRFTSGGEGWIGTILNNVSGGFKDFGRN